jgi:hypothetical protein
VTTFVLTSRRFDFEEVHRRAVADESPAHLISDLVDALDARLVQPGDVPVTRLDRVLANVVGLPEHWATARHVMRSAKPGDLVYCNGEDIGLAVGLVRAVFRRRTLLAFSVMAPERVRARYLLRTLDVLRAMPLLVTGARRKAEFLHTHVKADESKVFCAGEQVDERFFRPATTPREPHARPIVASCGLEQRDYKTLADAVQGKDVDVKICAVSPNFSDKTKVRMADGPQVNIEMRPFEFSELRSLYQSADVTVIPLLDNEYSAGLTATLEAMACGCPVVITKTSGLGEELIDAGLVWGVPPDDADAMWKTIEELIRNPEVARERAARAQAYSAANFASGPYLDRLVAALRSLESASPHQPRTSTAPTAPARRSALPRRGHIRKARPVSLVRRVLHVIRRPLAAFRAQAPGPDQDSRP